MFALSLLRSSIIGLTLLSSWVSLVHAAVPATKPASAPASISVNGQFADYFTNLRTFAPCDPWYILQRFKSDMNWECRNFEEVMKEYIAANPAPAGKVLQWFNSTNGQPVYGNGWSSNALDIYYNGNVGIGINSPTAKLDVRWNILAHNGYGNWLYIWGDASGNDFEIWASGSTVSNIAFYNKTTGLPMSIWAGTGTFSSLRITWGTPWLGKVLTSDAAGNATWSGSSSSIPPWYIEKDINLDEDMRLGIVSIGWPLPPDTCNWDTANQYTCSPTEMKWCTDVYAKECGEWSCAWEKQPVLCKNTKILSRTQDVTPLSRVWTFEIVERRYSFETSSAYCKYKLTIPGWICSSAIRTAIDDWLDGDYTEMRDAECITDIRRDIQLSCPWIFVTSVSSTPNSNYTSTWWGWITPGLKWSITVNYVSF
jgi:hypothetical protein